MRVIRISNTMREIPLSEDMAEAVKRITKVDFNIQQCVDSKSVSRLFDRLSNFRKHRTNQEFCRYMQFYGLFDLVDGQEFDELVDTLRRMSMTVDKTGLAVVVTE